MVDLQDIRNGLKSAYDEITKKIESNKIIKAVVSAGVLSILQGIPVVGPFLANVYTNATGSDDYKSNQILELLENMKTYDDAKLQQLTNEFQAIRQDQQENKSLLSQLVELTKEGKTQILDAIENLSLQVSRDSEHFEIMFKELFSLYSTGPFAKNADDPIRIQSAQHLPHMDNIFTIVKDSTKIENALLLPQERLLPSVKISYAEGRIGTVNVQKDLLMALLAAGGMLIVQGRGGLGKTQELVRFAENQCRQGWTVCIAKKGEADLSLDRLAFFPEELRNNRLLLIFDDLHHRVHNNRPGQKPYSDRLEAFLDWLNEEVEESSIRLLGTIRDEPSYRNQLAFSQLPWGRFKLFSLPEFKQSALENVLIELTKQTNVFVDQSYVGLMVANSDGRLVTLFENVKFALADKKNLTLQGWKPSRGELWDARFQDAQGRCKNAVEVYQSIYLMHQALLYPRFAYVLRLSSNLAKVNTESTICKLIDMGLLRSYIDTLDVFSDEQVREGLRVAGCDLPALSDKWEALIEAFTEVAERPAEWFSDIIALSRRLVDAERYDSAIRLANTVLEEKPDYFDAYLTRCEAQTLQGNYKEAEEGLDAASGGGIRDPKINVLRGVVRFAGENYVGAEADYNEAINRGYNDPSVYYGRGLAQTNNKII